MRRFNKYIAVLLLVVAQAHFCAAFADTADPTPSQIVSAIKRAHIEGTAAGNPGLASGFVVYRCCGGLPSGADVYGPYPGAPGDHFSLSGVKYLTVNGQHLVLFQYVEGNSTWKEFAFFVHSLNYAGELPGGPNIEYQPVGRNLVVSLHTMRTGDAFCCPSGPRRTIAILSANSHGLFTPR